MSAPRSPTKTKVVPAGGRPIVSTVSAQTADARVCGVTPLGGRAQIVWWARPSVAPEGSTARQLCAKNPVPRSLPTRPAPLSVRCGEQGQPSRTGSRPNDGLHRACPVPRSAPEGRQICKGYETLSSQKKNVGNGQD